jgi:hypothetical protein
MTVVRIFGNSGQADCGGKLRARENFNMDETSVFWKMDA